MKRERICLLIAILMAAVITGGLVLERGLLVEARVERAQQELAQEVLRFHVLANSDSEEDQQMKMQVKDAVLSYMKKHLPENADLAATRQWAKEHLSDIESLAETILLDAACDYTVEAELAQVWFPKKTYGDVMFPAGAYEALRVKIGAAQGQNWWCCLYPKLCFTTAVHAVVPDEGKQELAAVLNDDSYEMITAKTDYKIRWFFFGGER